MRAQQTQTHHRSVIMSTLSNCTSRRPDWQRRCHESRHFVERLQLHAGTEQLLNCVDELERVFRDQRHQLRR